MNGRWQECFRDHVRQRCRKMLTTMVLSVSWVMLLDTVVEISKQSRCTVVDEI